MFPFTDPVLVFTILIVTILLAPLLAGRLRVPDLVLLLAAGMILGPNGLHVLERDSAITLFGSVGLIYIMFLAGLEIDLQRFRSTCSRSVGFGVLTFLVPQCLGALVGRYVLGLGWSASVLLASMFASHTLLAYPIASRVGITRSEPVSVTVSATILTDTLALLVLAVIADSTRGIRLGLVFWVGIVVGMSALILLTWWGIPWLTRWFFHKVTEAGGSQFLFVLGTVCGCAYLSHYAKMEPIVGAFLAGAAFNRLIPEHSTLMNRVVFAGNNLFIPFFLISVGMLVDPMAMAGSPRTWLVAAVMVAAVVGTKYLAAWIAATWFGYDANARQVMFGLSVVQAAATLAAVLVGFDLKIFDESVLNGTIAMIAVTCPLGAWMVDRYGRRMATGSVSVAPAVAKGQRLLALVANPEAATRLLELSFLLRDASADGRIHALTVVRDEGDTEEAVIRGEQLIGQCLGQAAAADVSIVPSVRVDTNPSDGIVRAAKELHPTLGICGMGRASGRGFRVFGTVMENLLDGFGPRLLFCRLVEPLNTSRRLLVLWGPLMERRSDLVPLLQDVARLARQMTLEIRVFAVGEEPSVLREQLTGQPDSRPLHVEVSASFGQARSALLSALSDCDLVLLPSERRGASLWTPSMDRLPERLAARYPRTNLLVAYPSLSPEWDASSVEEEENPASGISFSAIDVTPGVSLEEGLMEMAQAALPGAPERALEAGQLLLGAARSFPVPLADGVVLLHGHCRAVDQPMLVVARASGGWEFAGVAESTQVVLALLSPEGVSAEAHLVWLKYLAVAFHDEAVVRCVAEGTAQQIAGLLQGKRASTPAG